MTAPALFLVTGDFGWESGRALGVFPGACAADACAAAATAYAGRANVEGLQAWEVETADSHCEECEACGRKPAAGAQVFEACPGAAQCIICHACAVASGPSGCATCAGLGHPSGSPECPECGK